jgi:uncharacterized protein
VCCRPRRTAYPARALALAVAAALTAPAAALAATPLPPRADRSVYDTADLIDPADEATLEARNTELYEKTGVAIVIVTVPRLVDETIDQLAVRAGTEWGVGRRGQDRGLVIALSRDDRKIFVATGYGTEEYLPDGKIGALLDREAIPHLRRNEFSAALVELDAALAAESATHYGATLTGAPAQERPVEKSRGSNILSLIGIAVVVLVVMRFPWLLLWFGGGGFGGFGRRGGRGGGGFGGFGGGGFGGGGAGRDF